MDEATQKVEGLDESLAELVRTAGPEVAARAFDGFAKAVGLSEAEITALRPQLDAYNGALDQNKLANDAAAASQKGVQGALGGTNAVLDESVTVTVTEADKAAKEELAKTYESLGASVNTFIDPMDAYNTVLERSSEAARRHAEETAAATEDTKDSWEDYATQASVSLSDFTAELDSQITAYDNFTTNLYKIAARGRADVATELAAMGEEGAVLAEQFVAETDEKFNSYGDTLVEAARKKPEEAGQNLDTGFKILAVIADQGAAATVQSVMTQLGPMPGLTEEIVRETAERANVQLQNGEPAWNQSWANRYLEALGQTAAVRDEVPPIAAEGADLVNQYLAERYPGYAQQWGDRKNISVTEMQAMLETLRLRCWRLSTSSTSTRCPPTHPLLS